MKKKVLSIALIVALIAIVVSGSLAYFTDRDEVNNTFTIGSVKSRSMKMTRRPKATPSPSAS